MMGQFVERNQWVTDIPLSEWTHLSFDRTLSETGENGKVIFHLYHSSDDWSFHLDDPKLCIFKTRCSPVDCGNHPPPANSVPALKNTAFQSLFDSYGLTYPGYNSWQTFSCNTGFTTDTNGQIALSSESINATCTADGSYDYTDNLNTCYPVKCADNFPEAHEHSRGWPPRCTICGISSIERHRSIECNYYGTP